MGFFDLNIPYFESDKHITDKAARKTARLKLVVKAMELGFAGVAYNRTIKGVMSESDRCVTPLFPLSSVLKLAPSLSAAVKLHRDLLNVPSSAAFRQYTRLTVAVDSSSQASALNSGNPILKTYDIVAVRPLNQNAFEQACQASEVDLISIDFSEKLPFRLKLPMVIAAIKRGVYFEISYSGLVMDAQARRQLISNAKLLVDWTKGKNLIFSSAAPSVTELRGPNDVANLSSLLGLPMERAKGALSKNCRSLITNALRKKHYYKEAIRVEVISSGEHFDSKEPFSSDWFKWDPISSGEGDLLLDDIASSSSASTKVSKTVKAIDFASVMDSLSSHGLQGRDMNSAAEAAAKPFDIGKTLSAAGETELSIAVIGSSQQPESLDDLPKADQTSLYNMPSQHSIRRFRTTNTEEEAKNSNEVDANFTPHGTDMHNLQAHSGITSCDAHVLFPAHNAALASGIDTEIAENSTPSKDIDFSAFRSEGSKSSSISDLILVTHDCTMEEVLIKRNTEVEEKLSASYAVSLNEDFIEREQLISPRDDVVSIADESPVVKSYDEIKDIDDHSIANCEKLDMVAVEERKQIKDHARIIYPAWYTSSGKGKSNQRRRNQTFLFPLKRLLNPRPLKRKTKKSKTKVGLL
ncbi:ribonuclease P [Sarracenia purpurea var. burkii]